MLILVRWHEKVPFPIVQTPNCVGAAFCQTEDRYDAWLKV